MPTRACTDVINIIVTMSWKSYIVPQLTRNNDNERYCKSGTYLPDGKQLLAAYIYTLCLSRYHNRQRIYKIVLRWYAHSLYYAQIMIIIILTSFLKEPCYFHVCKWYNRMVLFAEVYRDDTSVENRKSLMFISILRPKTIKT